MSDQTKIIFFYNIQWDTDGVSPERLGLPLKIRLEVPFDCDVSYDGADILSDKYGYCVHGFDFR